MVKWLKRVVEVLAAASTYLYKQAAGTAASTIALVIRLTICYEIGIVFRPVTIALLTLSTSSLFAGVVSNGNFTKSGVKLDGSLGPSGSLPGPAYMIPATVGKQVGTNLFHSFSQFDLSSNDSATFTGPNNIQNIVSRVTGGSPSSIDGTINSQIQGANLFFVNPAGVVFGSHAQINVTGSFAVSTANYLKMADGGRFNTNLGGGDVLTSAPVSSFGFLNSAPAPVSIIGSNKPNPKPERDVDSAKIIPGPGLVIPPAKSFSIVAGDITVDGGYIHGDGSRVNLVSVKSPGEAQFNSTDINNTAVDVTQFTALGNIALTDFAFINTSGPSGGPISINGGNLLVSSAQVIAETMGSFRGQR